MEKCHSCQKLAMNGNEDSIQVLEMEGKKEEKEPRRDKSSENYFGWQKEAEV